MGRLENKVTIVTGAGNGLGRAIALRFAREGAHVIAVTASDSAKKVVAEAAGSMAFFRCDVTDEQQVTSLMAHCRKTHGRLDILVNNAGIGNNIQARVHETDPAEWDRVMNVNVRGAFLMLKHALTLMLECGGGSVVNMASIGSHRGTPYSSPYITSKGAMLMLTRTAALEYARDNIRINAVCPGVTRTPLVEKQSQELKDYLASQVPQGRLGEVDEVAALCVFLASDEAPHITGADYLIDGGRGSDLTMEQRLKGKIAVVTGAGKGIGRAIAIRFVAEGAHVVAVTPSDSAKELAEQHAPAMEFFRCDISQPEQVEALAAHVRKKHGRLDVLSHNAGIAKGQTRVHEISIEDWDRIQAVNTRGAFLTLKYLIPIMIDSGGGSVVMMASIGSFRASPGSAAYITSRGAIMMLTKNAALDYVKDNIRVNAICPAATTTPMVMAAPPHVQEIVKGRIPQGRMGTPEEVAALAVFLASDEAPHMTGGHYLIDGGRGAG